MYILRAWGGVFRRSCFFALLAATGCSEPESADQTGEELVVSAANARVLGFEEGADWSGDAGTNQVHSQGQRSLSVDVSGWKEVTSIKLSTLGQVGGSLSLDVSLPATTTWGEARVIVKLPSHGESYRDLGGVPLAGLAGNRFHHLSLPIPADLRTKLAQGYSDLTFTVVINAPTGRYLLDGLNVGQEPLPSSPEPSLAQSVSVSLPLGSTLDDVVLGAANGLGIADRVRLPATPVKVTNAGSVETNVGVEVQVGDIVSAGPVTLRDRAAVLGSVKAQTPINYQNQSTVSISGSVQENAVLAPAVTVARAVAFPPAAPGVSREPNQTPYPLNPGSYGPVEIKTGSSVRLVGGDYYLESLRIHPGARLSVTPSTDPVIIYVKTFFDFKGIYELSGAAGDVFIGVLGAGTISLEAPLGATVVAANAQLRFAPLNPGTFTGSFFAGSIYQAEPGLTFVHAPFKHWGRVFTAVPKAECVTVQNATTRSARFSYKNELTTTSNVPHGPRNQVTPTPPAGFEPPTALLPGVHSYYVPFEGTQVTWQLEVWRAVANLDLRRCDASDFPIGQEAADAPIDPLSVSRPNAVALADAIPERPSVAPAPAPLTMDAQMSRLGAAQQAFTGGAPFTLRLTQLDLEEDGALASLDVDVIVTLDGHATERGLFDCPSGGCIYTEVMALDERFNVTPSDPTSVPVHIKLIERDTFGDDTELELSFTVDPRTGVSSWGAPCAESDGWGLCWDFVTTQPILPMDYPVSYCASFSGNYYDSGFGEDHLVGRAEQNVPASFARASVTTSWDGATIWTGYLDANGCTPQGSDGAALVASTLAFPASDTSASVTLLFAPSFCRAPDGVTFATPPTAMQECLDAGGIVWNVQAVSAGFSAVVVNGALVQGELDVSKKVSTVPTYASVVARSASTESAGWMLPAATNALVDQLGPGGTPTLDDMTRVAGVVTQILRTDDFGVTPGRYDVMANDSCPSDDPEVVGDACVTANRLWIGKGKLGFFDDNMLQSRWKYVTAHEAGHLIQRRAIGGIKSSEYTFANNPPGCPVSNQVIDDSGNTVCADPPATDAMCRCDHVDLANKLHCLQSLEAPGGGQLEGFAQFYASKVWNRRSDADCTFVYYKEFLDQACRSGECSTVTPSAPSRFATLQRSIPPVAMSCAAPTLWRNNNCNVPAFGTELDWLSFFWTLHGAAPGAMPLAMADINSVYTTSCGGSCAGDQPWKKLAAAAVTRFGLGSAKATRFAAVGAQTGVNEL